MRSVNKLLLTLFLILFISGFAHAAVTFDAVCPSATGQKVPIAGGNQHITYSCTASGTNRLAVTGFGFGAGVDTGLTVTCTYGGVSMTPTTLVHTNNATSGFVQMFYLINPATGAQTVDCAVNTTGTFALESGTMTFNGADQSTGIQNFNSAFGSSTTASASITSSAGNMVVGVVTNGDVISSSSQTSRYIVDNSGGATAGGCCNAGATAAGGGSVNMSWTVLNDHWAVVGMEIIAAAGGATPPTKRAVIF